MLKTTLTAAAILSAATAAQAVTFTFDAADGNGTGSQLLDEPSEFALSMVGANVAVDDSVIGRTTFTATAAFDAVFDIAWSFFTFDVDGPSHDPFGFFVEAVDTQLSDDFGPNFQNGVFTLSVSAGEEFGFFIESTDDVLGPGLANIAGTQVTLVPLPASGLMLVAGLGGMALRRRRKPAA